MMRRFALLALLAAPAAPLAAQAPVIAQSPPELEGALEIKWVRDSEEYAALARMVYRQADRVVTDAARRLPRGRAWAVVLDLDETTLDNSVYQLSRKAYQLPFDTASWNAWVRRQDSGAVPGVVDFSEPANALFARFAEAGMHLVRSKQPMESWPGFPD